MIASSYNLLSTKSGLTGPGLLEIYFDPIFIPSFCNSFGLEGERMLGLLAILS